MRGEERKEMEIRIDDNAGYCFGVVKAIGAAEEVLGGGYHSKVTDTRMDV